MPDEENKIRIINTLVEQEGIEKIDLSNIGFIDPEILNLLPAEIAVKHKVIPFSRKNDSLSITMANPFNIVAQEAIRSITNFQPTVFFTPEAQIEEYLGKLYLQNKNIMESAEDSMESGVAVETERQNEDISLEVLENQAREAPAIRYVNNILLNAIQERASDIHIEPQEKELKIRFRIDGTLREVASPPKQLQAGIISRIKILASLDIAERRIPQDGRSKLRIFGRSVDIRVSTLPTIFGEKVVLRILDKDLHSLNTEDIGLESTLQERYKQSLNEPHGIILVTGPTGSGKSTTLYSYV